DVDDVHQSYANIAYERDPDVVIPGMKTDNVNMPECEQVQKKLQSSIASLKSLGTAAEIGYRISVLLKSSDADVADRVSTLKRIDTELAHLIIRWNAQVVFASAIMKASRALLEGTTTSSAASQQRIARHSALLDAELRARLSGLPPVSDVCQRVAKIT